MTIRFLHGSSDTFEDDCSHFEDGQVVYSTRYVWDLHFCKGMADSYRSGGFYRDEDVALCFPETNGRSCWIGVYATRLPAGVFVGPVMRFASHFQKSVLVWSP